MRKLGNCLETEIMQRTLPEAHKKGRPQHDPGVPRRQSHRRSGLATLTSVGAIL